MKKTIIFGSFVLLTSTSCVKNWTCQCVGGVAQGADSEINVTIKTTKQDAKSECKNMETTYTQEGNEPFTCTIH